MKWKNNILKFIRYAFIILLFYSSISKLIEYPQFYIDLLNSPVFGNEKFAVLISWLIPIIELVLADLLISTYYRRVGLYLASGLILLFTLYIIGILGFSNHIPCSCGGIINNFTWQEHLVFNICFLLLGGIGIYLQNRKKRKVYIK